MPHRLGLAETILIFSAGAGKYGSGFGAGYGSGLGLRYGCRRGAHPDLHDQCIKEFFLFGLFPAPGIFDITESLLFHFLRNMLNYWIIGRNM